MKREIFCPPCRTKVVRIITPSEPGEYHKAVAGKALREFLCDNCGGTIKAGEPCVAFSMYADSIPYFEWENEFVEVSP